MKKFMKTCGILALIMILAGIVMTSVAGIIKGPEVIATVKGYISDGLEKLDSGVRFDVEADMDFNSNEPVLEGATGQKFAGADVNKLDIEVGTCELNILPSEDEYFYVDVEGAGTYQGYLSDETLCIKAISSTGIGATLSTDENQINLDIQASGCEIDLFVPADFYFEEVKLSLGAGAISNSAVFKVDALEIELAAGEIELPNMEVNGLTAEVGAGTLTYMGSIQEAVDVECGMGEVELELSGTETDFNYDVEVAAGDVTIGRESFGGIAGERSIDNNASKDINIECAMGAVEVTFAN